MKNQRGSATVLALLSMIFLGIVIAGLLPMLSNELRFGTMNKDIIEAQYAAEAGAKRAIVEFNKVNLSQTPDWSWLNLDIPYINDVTKKKYNVIIYRSTDATETPVDPPFSNRIKYTLKSIGTVNEARKTVYVSIGPEVVPGLVGDAAIYGGKSINLDNGATINGASIASGGIITTGRKLDIADPYGVYPNKTLPFPQYSAATYKGSSTELKDDLTTLTGGSYYREGNWVIANNTVIGGNGIIFVNGDIIFPQNVEFTGKVLVISTGDINASNSNKIDFPSGVLISYGDINFKNSFALIGAVLAEGNVSFKNSVTITYDSSIIGSFGIPTSNRFKIDSWKIQ